MQPKSVLLLIALAPLALILARVSAGAFDRQVGFPAAPALPAAEVAWAEAVRDSKPGDATAGIYANPDRALGEWNVEAYSMGNVAESNAAPPANPENCAAYLILDFGDKYIVDGPDTDIGIYELVGGGVAEESWVYVGLHEGLESDAHYWFVDVSIGGIDSVDLAAIADQDAPGYYNLVALCTRPAGTTSGSPFGGPDIDAVSAIHWTAGYDPGTLVSTTRGEGVKINDQPSPDGEAREAQPGDTFEGEAGSGVDPGGVDFEKACDILILDLSVKLRHSSILHDQNTVRYLAELLVATMQACADSRSPDQDQDILEFELYEGGLSVEVPGDTLDLTIRTATAAVRTQQPTRYAIGHDPAAGETVIRAGSGSLAITPANPALPPFVLPPSHVVVISADAMDDPYADVRYYLPAITGN